MSSASRLQHLFEQLTELQAAAFQRNRMLFTKQFKFLLGQFEQRKCAKVSHLSIYQSAIPNILFLKQLRRKLEDNYTITQNKQTKSSNYTVVQYPMPFSASIITAPREKIYYQTEAAACEANPYVLLNQKEAPVTLTAIKLVNVQQQQISITQRLNYQRVTLKALAEHCASIIQRRNVKEREHSKTLFSNLILVSNQAIQDTIACSSIYSELVNSNSKQKQIIFQLINQLKTNQQSPQLKEINYYIQKKKIKGILTEIFPQLPFIGSVQKFTNTLPGNKQNERNALIFSLAALKAKIPQISFQMSDPGSANLFIKQFTQFCSKKAGLLISSQQHIKSLDFPKNVRVFPYNKYQLRNQKLNQHEMYEFGLQTLRINFFGEKKAEQDFELVDLDLVTVDFEQIKLKKIDLTQVLKELKKQNFDFCIINRLDFYMEKENTRVQLFDIKSDFCINILGDQSQLRWFNGAAVLLRIEPQLLQEFKPELVQTEENQENLLFKLEKAAHNWLNGQLLVETEETKENKQRLKKHEIVLQQQKLRIDQIVDLIYSQFDKVNDSIDIKTQITTQLQKLNTTTTTYISDSYSENEQELTLLDKISYIRQNILNFHSFTKKAPENVASCLKSDVILIFVEVLLGFLDQIEKQLNYGVKCAGKQIIQYDTYEWLQIIMQQPYFINPIMEEPLILQSAHEYQQLDCPAFASMVDRNYDNFSGELAQFGRSLGIFISQDIFQRKSQQSQQYRHVAMFRQLNYRSDRKRLQQCDYKQALQFAREYFKQFSDDSAKNYLATPVTVPSFNSHFKFINFFNLSVKQDIQVPAYTFYFSLYDYQQQLDQELLQLDSTDFQAQYVQKYESDLPSQLARQFFSFLRLGEQNRKFLALNDTANQFQMDLSNYIHNLTFQQTIDNQFTDVCVLPGPAQLQLIQNLEENPGKVQNIYIIKQQQSQLSNNQILACCQLITDYLPFHIQEKLDKLLKQEKFSSYGHEKLVFNAQNYLETVNLKEKEISQQYFANSFIQKKKTPAVVKLLFNLYQQFQSEPCAIKYANSYQSYLISTQKLLNFTFGVSFQYLQQEKKQYISNPLFATVVNFQRSNIKKPQQFNYVQQIPLQRFQTLDLSPGTFRRLRIALNSYAHNKLYQQIDVRRDNYQTLISVPVFLETAPFKRYFCPKCCVYNEFLSTCFHLIQQCAKASLQIFRCRAEGNFMFPDIFFYNSYMHLYRNCQKVQLSADISSIILIIQISKQNKDFVQHVANDKIVNMIFAQFAEPIYSNGFANVKFVLQQQFAQTARILRPGKSRMTLRQAFLINQFEFKALRVRQVKNYDIQEAYIHAEKFLSGELTAHELIKPIMDKIDTFKDSSLKCDFLDVAKYSLSPLRALQYQNQHANFIKQFEGCIKPKLDYSSCAELVARNMDGGIEKSGRDAIKCGFQVKIKRVVKSQQLYEII